MPLSSQSFATQVRQICLFVRLRILRSHGGSYTLEQRVPECSLALFDGLGETWKMRRTVDSSEIENHDGVTVLSSSKSPWPDVTVQTYLIPPAAESPHWHILAHKIMTGRHVQTAEGAFALRWPCTYRFIELLLGWLSCNQQLAISRSGAVGIVRAASNK